MHDEATEQFFRKNEEFSFDTTLKKSSNLTTLFVSFGLEMVNLKKRLETQIELKLINN